MIIQYGTQQIEFDIQRNERKSLTIVVLPDGTVLARAPLNATDEAIAERIHKRAAWILKQQQFFKSFDNLIPPRRFVSGESHFYLGRQYLLHVTEGRANTVNFKNGHLEIVCKPKSKAEALLKEWYRCRAKMKFSEIAEPIIQRFAERYGVEPSSFYIQEMENRWGSCTNNGKLTLNTELIKASRPCIEYVVTHELCHLLFRNHTQQYYDLLGKEMPDWQKWKNKLEKSAILFSRFKVYPHPNSDERQ